jgi:hypothetical protein
MKEERKETLEMEDGRWMMDDGRRYRISKKSLLALVQRVDALSSGEALTETSSEMFYVLPKIIRKAIRPQDGKSVVPNHGAAIPRHQPTSGLETETSVPISSRRAGRYRRYT